MAATEYRCIGKGFCGSVWAGPNFNGYAMKRADGGPGRSLQNDWQMHNTISNSMQHVVQNLASLKGIDIVVPRPRAFIPADDTRWWNEQGDKFPRDFSHCNTLVSTRIPPLPATVRSRLIDRFCPAALVERIKSNPPDEDCLVRPYLGRRKIGQRKSRFQAFTLRNFPLHVDQMEDLGIDLARYAEAMADTLAVLYWVAHVDANDIEYVLAAAPQDGASTITSMDASPFECHFLGSHKMWLLDFDCCRAMTMDDAGISQAVTAFFRNDPFYPRPCAMNIRDQELWRRFTQRFLKSSAQILDGSEYVHLPQIFLEQVEEKGRQLVQHKQNWCED